MRARKRNADRLPLFSQILLGGRPAVPQPSRIDVRDQRSAPALRRRRRGPGPQGPGEVRAVARRVAPLPAGNSVAALSGRSTSRPSTMRPASPTPTRSRRRSASWGGWTATSRRARRPPPPGPSWGPSASRPRTCSPKDHRGAGGRRSQARRHRPVGGRAPGHHRRAPAPDRRATGGDRGPAEGSRVVRSQCAVEEGRLQATRMFFG
jgi:hypothetical protein